MRVRVILLAAWTLAAVAAGVLEARQATTPARPAATRPAAAPTLHRLAGRLELTQGGRPASDRTLDRTRAAVWFEPSAAARPPVAAQKSMITVRKQFDPQVLVVPVGSTVRFPNQDPILHNVFSVSGKNSFDLGLVGAGQGKSATFRESGVVRVFCNVHHAMYSHVVVVATPYFAVPDSGGRFVLEGVPAGRGKLRYWHERGEIGEYPVNVPHGGELAVSVAITQPRVPPHKNKLGKSYTRGAYE